MLWLHVLWPVGHPAAIAVPSGCMELFCSRSAATRCTGYTATPGPANPAGCVRGVTAGEEAQVGLGKKLNANYQCCIME